MSVAVSSSTVVSPLWRTSETGGLPATIPLREEGTFLSFQLTNDTRSAEVDSVTFVAFHPVDETCFVFGTAAGRAYGVSLQDNKLFLLADLGSGALRCGIFCPGYLTGPIVVLVRAGNLLIFVDWQRGAVVQETPMMTHRQPILRLVTGASTESLFCAVSADAFSCWEPLAKGARAVLEPTEQQQRGRAPATDVQWSTWNAQASNSGAPAAPMQSDQKVGKAPDGLFYVCTGSAAPSQCTLITQQGPVVQEATQHLDRATHRFLGLHVITTALLLSVESNNVLSLWTRPADAASPSAIPGQHFDSICTENGVSGAMCKSGSMKTALQLRESVTAPSTLRVRCSAHCGTLVALGADAVATSKHGLVVEPVVAFVDARTLAGTGVVRLPSIEGGRYNSNSAVGIDGARDAVKTVVTVVQVSAFQSDLVACLLSTGAVHMVMPSTYHLVFTIRPPASAVNDTVPRGLTFSTVTSRSRWCFTPSGPTFGAMYKDETLFLLHLPTARREAVANSRGTQTVPHPAAICMLRKSDSVVQERRRSSTKRTQNSNSSIVSVSGSTKSPHLTVQETAAAASAVTLAQPFLRHRPISNLSTTGTATCGGYGVECSSVSFQPVHADNGKEVQAALMVLATCRPPITVPRKGFPAKWVDVNLVDIHYSELDGAHGTGNVEEKSDTNCSTAPYASRPCPSEHTVWSEAKFCDVLPAISCRYNLEQLRVHLWKYGCFPHAYRTLIWRFLVGLPTKARMTSQFAALARRPRHIAVEQLLQPFPLPPNKTRDAIEEALSCLCWASPVLTLASYLPVLVYPLVMLYRDDVETVVELVLLFFANWGQEFFVCHPHGPTSLLAAMERELCRLDAALHQHLTVIGATVEVWGWELLTSFYTDVLTGPEWLQVMDHAFASSPLWLFAFHIKLICTRLRRALMAAVSADEVRHVLSQPPGGLSATMSMQAVLEDTYRLHSDWMKDASVQVVAPTASTATECSLVAELSSYVVLHTLSPSFCYPDGADSLHHDPVILEEKMRELTLVQRSRDETAEAVKRYAALQKEAETVAAAEAAFVQRQRARVAAKYDASTAAWQVQVGLEQSRQQQEAQERQLRWAMVQRRTNNAATVAALHAEMNTVESQLRHDMVDRHMEQLKWGLATHLTEEELGRMQRAAEEQVERAMRHMQEDAALQTEEVARFHAEPVLTVDAQSSADDVFVEDAEAGGNESLTDLHNSPSSFLLAAEESRAAASQLTRVKVQKNGTCTTHSEPVHSKSEGVAPDVEVKHSELSQNTPQVSANKRNNTSSSDARSEIESNSSSTARITTTVTGTSPSQNKETNEPPEHDLREKGSANKAICASATGPSPADVTTISAETRTYVSSLKEDGSSCQPRQHQAAPYRPLLTPRHASNQNPSSSISGSASTTTAVSDPNLQSFVELRNRVLRRLQPVAGQKVLHNDKAIPLRHHHNGYGSLSSRTSSKSRESKITTTDNEKPPFSSASYSYYTSDNGEGRSGTDTSKNATERITPQPITSASGNRHRLFYDLLRPRDGKPTENGNRLTRSKPRELRAQRPLRNPTTASTTTTTSTLRSTSYDKEGSTSYSWSYYDYSTGRSGEGTSITGSFPRSSTSY